MNLNEIGIKCSNIGGAVHRHILDRSSRSKLWMFVSIFLVMFIGQLPAAAADEESQYIGKIYSFGELPGFAFSGKENRTIDREYMQVLFVERKYFLLAAKHDEGEVIVVDAVAIPSGQSFVGRPIENECKAKEYANETIFAIGKWVNRKTPEGGFAGGYANPVTKAWKVNFQEKRLEVIPVKGIKCEDNRTDADVI